MPPLMKQSHYAELDRKWLSEKRYNHPEQEMFNVPYAVVDRAATASGAPPLVKVQPQGDRARSQGCAMPFQSTFLTFQRCLCTLDFSPLNPNLSTLGHGGFLFLS